MHTVPRYQAMGCSSSQLGRQQRKERCITALNVNSIVWSGSTCPVLQKNVENHLPIVQEEQVPIASRAPCNVGIGVADISLLCSKLSVPQSHLRPNTY